MYQIASIPNHDCLANTVHQFCPLEEDFRMVVKAVRNIKAGEIILTEAPLVLGPAQTTIPVCLGCYVPVDGSYKCPR